MPRFQLIEQPPVTAARFDGQNGVDLVIELGVLAYETNALAWNYDIGAYVHPRNGKPMHTGRGGMWPNCLIIGHGETRLEAVEGGTTAVATWVETDEYELVEAGDWIVRVDADHWIRLTDAQFTRRYAPLA